MAAPKPKPLPSVELVAAQPGRLPGAPLLNIGRTAFAVAPVLDGSIEKRVAGFDHGGSQANTSQYLPHRRADPRPARRTDYLRESRRCRIWRRRWSAAPNGVLPA